MLGKKNKSFDRENCDGMAEIEYAGMSQNGIYKNKGHRTTKYLRLVIERGVKFECTVTGLWRRSKQHMGILYEW